MTEDPRILLGKRIAQIRKEKGLSQDKLAWEGGLARSFIGEVERGLRNPTLTNICKLAEALDVKAADLFSLIDNEDQEL
jgi:transcriptional regulator with XRE-family HTH domain